ncbi:hypothetical protein KKF34_11325 [Myxococcota bacterium]|nr:hypothetical protein [Myxococcota bacterium]MBU1497454.1 hypothetical protein [Myxococcota bacterium]
MKKVTALSSSGNHFPGTFYYRRRFAPVAFFFRFFSGGGLGRHFMASFGCAVVQGFGCFASLTPGY